MIKLPFAGHAMHRQHSFWNIGQLACMKNIINIHLLVSFSLNLFIQLIHDCIFDFCKGCDNVLASHEFSLCEGCRIYEY